jgi:hypothetical protein
LTTAFDRGVPDRLPVTTHHVMPYFLEKYMDGISIEAFFESTGMDPIRWEIPVKPDDSRGEYYAPDQEEPGFLQTYRIFSDAWRIESQPIPSDEYQTRRETIHTPSGSLTAVIQGNRYTEWVAEHLIKERRDLEILAAHQTMPICDVDAVNRISDEIGGAAILRGFIIPGDIYGQPGCWQDFCCMRGTERAIMDTYDDPAWVREFLSVIQRRKLHYARSLAGAAYDITELGGGDASTTVINPTIFDEFVAPYDEPVVRAIQESGVRVAYHTCGGMMPILENVAAMRPNAMETFTPPEMGADVDLAEAKRRIGDNVCMIGGFDQGHYFLDCTPEETRREVRECFEAAGGGGGYVLAPSDHFFDADPTLVHAFADEARRCTY